jgi:hypothetical protein
MNYGQVLNTEDPAGKIDDKATNGLSGTANSLAHRVGRIQNWLMSGVRWFGKAASPNETTALSSIANNPDPIQLDAGNDDWGSWTIIIGSDDTPIRSGFAYFDPDELIIDDSENASEYFIQFARGDDGSTGYAAGTYTELVFNATVQKETGILNVQSGVAPAGSKVWGRCLSKGDNTGTIDFYIGIREFQG